MISRQRIQYALVLFLGCTLVGVNGCGGKKGVDGPTGTVSGTITMKGGTIPEGSSVIFMPEKGGTPASAKIDSSGNFSLLYKGESAIPVGKYKVAVTLKAEEMSPEAAMEANMKKGKKQKAASSAIPTKYQNPETSGKTFEVKEGENTFTWELTK
ncbi:MAG: hypothetical protein Tsb009_31120 [Planctomycetaceae bacterium]